MTKVSKLVKFKNYYKGTSLSYFVRIHGGLIKTIMLGVVTLIMLHLATCVWCFIGKIESDAPFTWIDRYKLSNASNFEVYLTGLYFCLVSLTTVGYGDYTAYTNSSSSLIQPKSASASSGCSSESPSTPSRSVSSPRSSPAKKPKTRYWPKS